LANQIFETCNRIKPVDSTWQGAAAARQLTLTKPPGSLGQLEVIGNRIAAILGTDKPQIKNKRIYVIAGDHGVTEEGVSAYPRDVTFQMVMNFLNGGAAINVLSRHGGIEVKVVDAGVDYDFPAHDQLMDRKVARGSANFAKQSALTAEQTSRAIIAGIDLAQDAKRDGVGIIGIGEMGIGNTTSASAITAALTGYPPKDVTGRGTGVDDKTLAVKIAVIERALERHSPKKNDAIDILSKVGGTEIGVMMGLAIGAAAEGLPIVADGFISTAAAALAVAFCPTVADYLFVGHRSEEQGHNKLIAYIGAKPILDLGLRLGEGTGAALAMHLLEASAKILCEMATFGEAGVSDKES